MNIAIDIVWIAAGLAVLMTVVVYFLGPLYEAYKYDKACVDVECELYEMMLKAMHEHYETGKPVTITFSTNIEDLKEAIDEQQTDSDA